MIPACYQVRLVWVPDSLDSFSNFDKPKPYNFEPTLNIQFLSDNKNTDREVSPSAMQTKEVEKERKENLDSCLCRKCKTMSTNAENLCREKKEVSDKILKGNFLHFWSYNMDFFVYRSRHSVLGIIGTSLKLKFSKVPR